MSFEKLSIRDRDGAALLPGEIMITSPDGACARMPAGRLAFVPGPRTRIEWVETVERGSDQLCSTSWPIFALEFKRAVPAIESLHETLGIGPAYTLSSPGAALAHISMGEGVAPGGYRDARVETFELAASAEPDGLRFRLAGQFRAKRRDVEDDGASNAGQVAAVFTVPWTYLALRGWSVANRDRDDPPRLHAKIDFGRSLASLAIGRCGQAFFEGTLNFGRPVPPYDGSGHCVHASIQADELVLQLAEIPSRRCDGLADARGPNGPQIILHQLGYRMWMRMLEQGDAAHIALDGAGIGQIDGQTGNVMEVGGPMTQGIVSCAFSLACRDGMIAVEVAGTVHPPDGDWAPLGPTFSGRFLVSEILLAVRGVRLPGADRRRAALLAAVGGTS